jgi:urease accessory protein
MANRIDSSSASAEAKPQPSPETLLRLLQLTSPTLPVGAYTYSEGLETLVQQQHLTTAEALESWLQLELSHGTIRLEAVAIAQTMSALAHADRSTVQYWNDWLSALRETQEMREQSWQMGRSLNRLLCTLAPFLADILDTCGEHCNFAIAFAIAAQHWQIDPQTAALGYLQSWASNLITAGVRLIPLGQTTGQQILLNLSPALDDTAIAAQSLTSDTLYACNWGVAIASMNHETLYSRLFRS